MSTKKDAYCRTSLDNCSGYAIKRLLIRMERDFQRFIRIKSLFTWNKS